MSKLLRLPLTLLAVLAAMLFLPGIAWGDPLTPSDAQCAENAALEGCATTPDSTTPGATTPGGDTTAGDPPAGDGTTTEQPKSDPGKTTDPATGTDAGTPTGTTGGQPGGPSTGTPTGSLLVIPFQPPTANSAPAVGLNDLALPALPLCDDDPATTTIPDCLTLPGGSSGTPVTCDELAAALGYTGGCPQNFSCDDLAALFGFTCPAGPPDCATLAALFHLEGCPQPPTSCQEFADLLGVDNCSQIPCLDTSKLPQQARDGLAPLFDGLKNIGIKQCPAPPAPATPGKGTYMPPTQQPAAQQQQAQQPYYANCTDARAQGATNIPQGSPGYRPELDADHDGFACDEAQAPVAQTAQPTGRLAYTGMDLGPQLNVAWTLLVLGTGALILGRRRA